MASANSARQHGPPSAVSSAIAAAAVPGASAAAKKSSLQVFLKKGQPKQPRFMKDLPVKLLGVATLFGDCDEDYLDFINVDWALADDPSKAPRFTADFVKSDNTIAQAFMLPNATACRPPTMDLITMQKHPNYEGTVIVNPECFACFPKVDPDDGIKKKFVYVKKCTLDLGMALDQEIAEKTARKAAAAANPRKKARVSKKKNKKAAAATSTEAEDEDDEDEEDDDDDQGFEQ
jgi:hypothetical protein